MVANILTLVIWLKKPLDFLSNSLYSAACFANFEGIWDFLFRQSFEWGRS